LDIRIIAAKVEERIEKKSEIRENFSKGFLLSLLDDMRICLEDFSVRSRINLRVCTFCAFTQRETRETSHKAVFMSLIFLRDKGEVKRIFCKKRGRKNFNALRKLPYRYWVFPPREEKATAARSK